jgi:glycosyltransferase involved in cell wall biosynthesis
MRVLFLNPFHGGSHAAVAEGYARHSRHDVTLLTLSIAGGWRWRMRGAAVTLARMLRARPPERYDLIVATDMLDLATFLGLTRDLTHGTPVALYMHENQLTYPLPPGRARDLTFPWINYTAALAADALLFNSAFHRDLFLRELPSLPGRYHDHRELDLLDAIAAKSAVLHPGIDLRRLDSQAGGSRAAPSTPPTILWNSRWEYDKGPVAFFDALRELERRGVDFHLIVAGEAIDPGEPSFIAAREQMASRTLHWGYAPDLETYRELLAHADLVVSAARQEFFGIAVIEAMYCSCVPVLPRRLSYPELLPRAYHEACLYDDDAALADRLQATIGDIARLRANDFRAVAAPYDWSRMAPRYDALFERVAARLTPDDMVQ